MGMRSLVSSDKPGEGVASNIKEFSRKGLRKGGCEDGGRVERKGEQNVLSCKFLNIQIVLKNMSFLPWSSCRGAVN